MASTGMLRRVALVRTDVSEVRSASFIRVIRIGELSRFLQEPHGVTTKKTPFFRVTAVKNSNTTSTMIEISIQKFFFFYVQIFMSET
jgi:3'-phosphoadenosine 5'-phosphosulfate sulfotransferase